MRFSWRGRERPPSGRRHRLQTRTRRNRRWTWRHPTRHPTHRNQLLRTDTHVATVYHSFTTSPQISTFLRCIRFNLPLDQEATFPGYHDATATHMRWIGFVSHPTTRSIICMVSSQVSRQNLSICAHSKLVRKSVDCCCITQPGI